LFYFGGWEGNRERLGFNALLTLPTADQRRGNFSAYSNTVLYDPATGAAKGSGRTPLAGNLVPASRQSAIVRKFQEVLPLPNRTGLVNANHAVAGNQKLNRDTLDVKVNYQASDTLMTWGKYSMMDAQVDCPASLGLAGGPGLCQGNPGLANNTTQVATISYNKTLSPTFLADGMLGYNRMGVAITGRYPNGNYALQTLGIPGTNGTDPRQAGAPMFVVAGYSALASDTGTRPAYWNDSKFTLAQNFGLIRSGHNIRFGYEGARHHLNHFQAELGGGVQGRFNFNNGVASQVGAPQTQFNAYAAFVMGLPEQMQKSIQYEKITAYNYQHALYLRDRWQVSSRLTLTLGLRWEYCPMMTRSGRGGIELWDPNTNLVSLGGAGGNPKNLGVEVSKRLLAPRVGFAYKLTSKTVLRSGYGLTYNPMPLARPLREFYPLTIAFDFNSANAFQPFRPLEQGIPDFGGPPLNQPTAPLPPTALMRWINGTQLRRGDVQSWNLILQRELPAGFIGSIGYVVTSTVRSFGDLNINAAAPGTGNAGGPFASRFNRTVDTNAWNGHLSANYHSLQTSIDRRIGDLTVKGAYTYSKAINFTDEDGWVGVNWNWLPAFSRTRARASFDPRHVFQMGYVYTLPMSKGKKFANSGLGQAVLGGWQLNGVFSSFTGNPFTVTGAAGTLNASGNLQTADQVKSEMVKLGGIGTGQPFYDPTAFASVTGPARFGSTGRNVLTGPGAVNLDLGLFRTFAIKERFKLQFRAESFNATNTPHFNAPNANLNAGNFLVVTAAEQDQRQFRLGLRLSW